jgi:hypothetical protein
LKIQVELETLVANSLRTGASLGDVIATLEAQAAALREKAIAEELNDATGDGHRLFN